LEEDSLCLNDTLWHRPRTPEAEIIESMTTYWHAKYPERFGSMLIDFDHPLLEEPGRFIKQIVDPDGAPAERTIHSEPNNE
jgi:hypothetical protein